ncbi:hypothetical protein WR25_19195 [Diploscapter pachys]|uniref:AAA domain-containing protein n=1 Tax=Diploscapter pachys TaxID=2018661 RepID=A0A2A2K6Z4_9BILA|nr:hypothetical protein WR25_19195 [Diploscapter pachys]
MPISRSHCLSAPGHSRVTGSAVGRIPKAWPPLAYRRMSTGTPASAVAALAVVEHARGIGDHRKVGARRLAIGGIGDGIGSRFGIAHRRGQIGARRKADDADTMRIDAIARRPHAQQPHRALRVLQPQQHLGPLLPAVHHRPCLRHAISVPSRSIATTVKPPPGRTSMAVPVLRPCGRNTVIVGRVIDPAQCHIRPPTIAEPLPVSSGASPLSGLASGTAAAHNGSCRPPAGACHTPGRETIGTVLRTGPTQGRHGAAYRTPDPDSDAAHRHPMPPRLASGPYRAASRPTKHLCSGQPPVSLMARMAHCPIGSRTVRSRPMATIAIYSSKGGVGKTTLAVNLAYCAATLSKRRTALWDLDPQAASSWVLGRDPAGDQARALFTKDTKVARHARPTEIAKLDLIPADASLRDLDVLLHDLGKKRRLDKLVADLGSYDHVLLDCPPGLTETSEQVIRAADLIRKWCAISAARCRFCPST